DPRGAAGSRNAHAAHAAAGRLHGLDAPLPPPGALLARALEQVHAELLPAEPAAAARVEQGHRVLGEVGEVAPDGPGVGDDVRAHRLALEAIRRRRSVLRARRGVEA